MRTKSRAFIALLICSFLLYLKVPTAIAATAGVIAFGINPFGLAFAGVSYPQIAGATKAGLITQGGADVQEVVWTTEVLVSAQQTTPFADNMTGKAGSGKPIVNNTDPSKVAGNQIVFNTVDALGAPIVQGNATRVGQEEALNPGNFRLTVDVGWIGTGIDNTGLTQTIPGHNYDKLAKMLIAKRLAKQQSDDVMQDLKCEANGTNTIYAGPGGKTIDTLGTNDTFQMSLIIGSGGRLRDLGAGPINARKPMFDEKATEEPPPIPRFLHFSTDLAMRPIKNESSYLQAMQLAKPRSDENNLFSGEYSDVDGQILYPWVNVRHGAIGSIGSACQVEALLGTALTGRATNSGVLPAGSGILDGGGSATKAVATPLRNFFEFWSLFGYKPINGVTRTFNLRGSSVAYGVIIDNTVGGGKAGFFSFTGNTGNQLTGVTFLGSTTTGNYATTVGSVTYNAGSWLTAADGVGFLGVSDGVFGSGSLMVEANSKGVPLCFGFGLGAMAVVSGYGNVPINNGRSFKPYANRTEYTGPHNQAFANGMEVCWGTAAFKRPDGVTPNFVLEVFARSMGGIPIIA